MLFFLFYMCGFQHTDSKEAFYCPISDRSSREYFWQRISHSRMPAEVRAIGDGASVTRGLQQASANGLSVARSILARMDQK